MSTFLEKIKQSYGDVEVLANGDANRVVPLSLNGRSVLLNDDLVYSILTAASNNAKSGLERREALFAYCFVCRVWSRAAQSLLFRHVFLQIRSSMMALLKIIDHRTERGQRLARSIQSATIKLSKQPESVDPPGLPMIHARHLPTLLCHMPNLYSLDLTMGQEMFKPKIIAAIGRGPRITALTIENPAMQLFADEKNPWPHLESIVIKGYSTGYMEDCTPPRIRLAQATIHYSSSGNFNELSWLIGHSKGTLSHISLISHEISSSSTSKALRHPHLRNIRSLTLGRIIWNDEILEVLHTFIALKELRFVSCIQLERDFPSNLPDSIEHLVVTVPFLPPVGGPSLPLAGASIPSVHPNLPIIVPDMDRPALLKSFTAVFVDQPGYAVGQTWAKEYAQLCEEAKALVLTIIVSEAWLRTSTTRIKPSNSNIPLRISGSDGKFQPSPSQLALVDFEIIIGGKGQWISPAPQQIKSSQAFTSAWLASQPTLSNKIRNAFSSVRDLVLAWRA